MGKIFSYSPKRARHELEQRRKDAAKAAAESAARATMVEFIGEYAALPKRPKTPRVRVKRLQTGKEIERLMIQQLDMAHAEILAYIRGPCTLGDMVRYRHWGLIFINKGQCKIINKRYAMLDEMGYDTTFLNEYSFAIAADVRKTVRGLFNALDDHEARHIRREAVKALKQFRHNAREKRREAAQCLGSNPTGAQAGGPSTPTSLPSEKPRGNGGAKTGLMSSAGGLGSRMTVVVPSK